MFELLAVTMAMVEDKSTFIQSLGVLFTLVVLFPAFYLLYGLGILALIAWDRFFPFNKRFTK